MGDCTSLYQNKILAIFGPILGPRVIALVDDCDISEIDCAIYKACETLTTLEKIGDDLVYTDEDGNTTNIALTDIHVNGFTFNSGTGDLTITLNDASSFVVNLGTFITSTVDTNSIDLSVSTGILSAVAIIDPDVTNTLVINPLGLFVPPAPVVVPGNQINVTYAQLTTHITNSTLVPGTGYLITNHQTRHIMHNTTVLNVDNTGGVVIPIEPLIVIASSTNTLSPYAQSTLFPNDIIIYTVNSGWWGDLEDASSMGAITYRHCPVSTTGDGNNYSNVSAPQDFRHCTFRRWNVDLTLISGILNNYISWDDTSINIGNAEGVTGPETLLSVDPGDFEDRLMFNPGDLGGNRWNTSNAHIREKIWYGPSINPVINGVFSSVVRDTEIKSADEFTIAVDLNHMYRVNTMKKFIFSTNQWINIIAWQSIDTGKLDDVFITVAIGNRNGRIGNLSRTSLHADLVGSSWATWMYEGDFTDIALSHIKIRPKTNGKIVTGGLRRFNNLSVIIQGDEGKFNPVISDLIPSTYINGGTVHLDLTTQTNKEIIFIKGEKSTIEHSTAAVSNLNPGGDVNFAVAGVVTLTGAGSVQIDTIAQFEKNQHPMLFKPVSGLDLTIPQNVVTDGFNQTDTVIANGTNEEVVKVTFQDDMWYAEGEHLGSATAYTSTAIDYTALSEDEIIEVTADATITLPTAVGITGKRYVIKASTGVDVIIDADGTETIDGQLTVPFSFPDAIPVVSNGTGWIIV